MNKEALAKRLQLLSEREKEVLRIAVTVIWLDDRSDYLNGLWDIVEELAGEEVYDDEDFDVDVLYKHLNTKDGET